MGRILSIDYGVRRTGIAVTDPLQIIAGGLTTVETPRLENWLKGYLATENVERFIVGLPKQTNGLDSENLKRVMSFVDRLNKVFPQIPVELWDERYTSVMAHRTMLESGISRKARQNKALVDEISATIILQGWMESQRQREKQNTNI
ncbi:MAG: Holliday junction resolvase RuvX [Bacteroidaceae bacterium]|nr:Holliday junction resolvase RuvX [Bacteroidaceae bacterium]